MPEIISTDITILGAGPGGCAAALFLAKAGIKSILADKAKFPRDKVCGDAVSGKVVEVLNKLDRSIVNDFVHQPSQLGSWGVTFVAPNLKALRVPFSTKGTQPQTAPGFISKRYDFDNYLVNLVRKEKNIRLLEECDVKSYKNDNDGWILKSGDAEVRTKILIDASGAHSSFSRHEARLKQEPEHYCAGLRAYYKNVSGLDNQNYIELHFLKEFLPGYFWIFPLPNGEANVGVGMRSDVVSKKGINLKKEMLNIIQTYPSLKERFKNAELVEEIKGYGLPLGSKKRKISGNNYLLTGDAASLIDPFTGEGIGNAMLSGMVAAEVAANAIAKNNFSAAFLSQYDDKVYKRLWNELRLSYRMQQMVNYPTLFNFVVNKANSNKTLSEMISSMFEDVDLRRKLKQPSFYFKLLFS